MGGKEGKSLGGATFVDGCTFARPFHLVAIDRRNRLRMISPVTVTCISRDGSGKSAKIEIEAARATMQ